MHSVFHALRARNRPRRSDGAPERPPGRADRVSTPRDGPSEGNAPSGTTGPGRPAGTTPFKSRPGWRRVLGAIRYSAAGFAHAVRFEAAFRQELFACLILLPVAFLAPVDPLRRWLLIASLGGVLVVELLNSAIEATIDRISLDHHELSGRAKDLCSAAVMLSLMLAVGTWVVILAPWVRSMF